MYIVKQNFTLGLSIVFFLLSTVPAFAVETVEAKVRCVVGGDEIIVLIEGEEERVRFIGADTPETAKPGESAEPFGPEALAFTEKNLAGETVWLEMDEPPRDEYRRLLAYVWLSPPESGEPTETEIRENLFNALLLLGGYAQLTTIPPNVRYAGCFTRFQEEAREHVRGLWSRYCPLQ
ncbi:MAG: thermonuclease family protein [Synergistaceae bacterium]|jgi:micrococcal nuclease|nr:thermonuclease family protein [Synergistaceae bacterium]